MAFQDNDKLKQLHDTIDTMVESNPKFMEAIEGESEIEDNLEVSKSFGVRSPLLALLIQSYRQYDLCRHGNFDSVCTHQ